MASSRPSQFSLTTPGPLRLLSTLELLTMPAPVWQIDGILPQGGLVGLYGAPGAGKSFLAIDMALSIATGRSWQGREVAGGSVLYISAEGGTGIGKRVRAWLKHYQVSPIDARVAWLIESLPIHSDAPEVDRLLERIAEANRHPSLVVVDTLARCFEGDENQQLDMGRFIAGVDQLRREWDATLLVVHHTRLDGERERGNTAFRGAADTMLAVEATQSHQGRQSRQASNTGKGLRLSCTKQKDAEEFSPISFRLEVVPDCDSCIVIPGRRPTVTEKQAKSPAPLSPNAFTAYGTLLAATSSLSWLDWQRGSNIATSSFHRAVQELTLSGLVTRSSSKQWSVTSEPLPDLENGP